MIRATLLSAKGHGGNGRPVRQTPPVTDQRQHAIDGCVEPIRGATGLLNAGLEAMGREPRLPSPLGVDLIGAADHPLRWRSASACRRPMATSACGGIGRWPKETTPHACRQRRQRLDRLGLRGTIVVLRRQVISVW